MIPNPVEGKGPSYLEIDELEEEEPLSVGPAPRMGTPYVEIPVSHFLFVTYLILMIFSPPQRSPPSLLVRPMAFKRTSRLTPPPQSGHLAVAAVFSGS